MKNIVFYLAIGFSIFQLTSCSKDDETLDDVTIQFINPTNNQQISLAEAENLVFNVIVTADKDLHDIFMKVYPTANSTDLIVDRKRHRHATSIEFSEERDLSAYSSGTTFTINIDVCIDHDCSSFISDSIEFSVL
jgi:hypothetical protein